MILERLTLHDFGLFAGRQALDLTPVQRQGRHRPIVLFGGVNGGGKTTLFDAVQLARYGGRARCAKRAGLSYDEFLRRSIHHGVPPEQGAAVWLTFRHAVEGQESAYEVRRRWCVQDGKLQENLLVLQVGLPNYSLSRNWAQTVEELVPLDISQLCFFDGDSFEIALGMECSYN
jgi:DNA sulfur modification protein DndD